MQWISKEGLLELVYELRINSCMLSEHNLVISRDKLLAECKELDPWMQIESAPKDRPIAVYCPPYQDLESFVSKCKWHESAGFCVDELRTPTKWMELPEDPK